MARAGMLVKANPGVGVLGMTTNLGVNGEVNIAYSSPEEFGRIVLDWLLTGVQVLASDISEELLAGKPVAEEPHRDSDYDHPLRPRPPIGGDVWIDYGEGGKKAYMKPYSRTSLDRLRKMSEELSGATISLGRKMDGRVIQCVLQADRVGDSAGFARLFVNIPADGCIETSPEIAYMRSFAAANVVAFGHVSPVDNTLLGWTELELGLGRPMWDSLTELDRYLRGYSWVTVVPEMLAARLGGPQALRESGAFCRVDVLAGGSVWLQATPRWSEYGHEQIDRVFEVLAPVLPPGMPESHRMLAPGGPGFPARTRPYLLSIRDAAEFYPLAK